MTQQTLLRTAQTMRHRERNCDLTRYREILESSSIVTDRKDKSRFNRETGKPATKSAEGTPTRSCTQPNCTEMKHHIGQLRSDRSKRHENAPNAIRTGLRFELSKAHGDVSGCAPPNPDLRHCLAWHRSHNLGEQHASHRTLTQGVGSTTRIAQTELKTPL